MGATDEIGKLPPVECTYKGCQQRFDTEKEMKYHKRDDPAHNYCKKCNVDCEDWEALVQHKVDSMAPFLKGRKTFAKDESPAHIVCEFCGEDFKSLGGREKHRKQMHPADQNITCKGCGDIFVRAGLLVAHYENGYCKEITSTQFRQQLQARHVSRIINEHLDHFMKVLGPQEYEPSLTAAGSEIQDSQEGGVHLLDHEYEGQQGGYKPLQAEVDLISVHESQPTRSNTETWPRLPGQKPSQLGSSMASMSIESRTPSVSSAGITASDFAREITRRGSGRRAHDEAYPFLKSPVYPESSISNNDDNISAATTTVGSPVITPRAWSTSNTSKELFKDVKTHPAPGDWSGITKYRQEIAAQGAEADQSQDIRTARWWDPYHNDYDADRFQSAVTGKFICPFPDCDGEYDIEQDVADHLITAHMKTTFRCPLCLKIFQSANALVSHCESAGKCRVKEGRDFHKLLDEISGGFLEGEELSVPKIYTPQTALVKAGQPTNGLMPMKFKAKLPHESKA